MLFVLAAVFFGLWLVGLTVGVGNFLAYLALAVSFVLLVAGFTRKRRPEYLESDERPLGPGIRRRERTV